MIEKKPSEKVLSNDPPSTDQDVAKLRLQLRHVSLVELEKEGVVNWDRDNHVVRKGSRFDEKWKENERLIGK